MENKIYRCFIFDEQQEKFLRDKRYKIDRMGCFMSLADKVVRVPTLVDISDHRQVELVQGQFIASDVELSHLWHLDRKTVGKLMKQMESLGMFTSTKVAEVCVYSVHILSGWIDNGTLVMNQFYRKPPKPNEPPKWKTPEVNQVFMKADGTREPKVSYPEDKDRLGSGVSSSPAHADIQSIGKVSYSQSSTEADLVECLPSEG